ncbi:MAG: carbamoyltransferase C-terminal domain-containing protein [Candidatus Nanoarchaeia archaeon]|nr:carbamoyltransferase [Candidatus Jingweiarchaeum tengchongense]
MIILGLNAYHGDSAACLVVDGKLIAAIEEERIRRQKHWAGLPTESVKWLLDYTKIDIKDVDYIAVGRNPSAHMHKKILRVMKKTPSFSFLKSRLDNASKIGDLKSDIAKSLGVDPSLIRAKIENVEHHRAHIASSFLVSPFDEAVSISIDGFGDFVSTMRGIGRGNEIEISDWVEFPHSLGIFYTALTQFLGFWKYGDEYKVMGLSAMGEPKYVDIMRKIIKVTDNGFFKLDNDYFLHDKQGVDMIWNGGDPEIGRLFSDKMIKDLGEPRDKKEDINEKYQDIAASVQEIYEEVFFHILNESYKKFKVDKLTLSGGSIQNSLANGKIFERTPFKEVYIPPASPDAGTAVGAAFWVWNIVLGNKRDFIMNSPFWGPEFSDVEIESILNENKIKYQKLNDEELVMKVAEAIKNGKIVGWFQGRTEWGPRALGNRSILVDPRKKEMKDILNERIKRREKFRPFAPSVLEDHVTEWFENSYPVPFMEKVYKIKSDKRELIPAVTHFDGTGRLQTVSKSMNIKYYKLIEQFYKLTNVPMVLNTSFNENEPIVNTPKDALECFLRTKMDLLALNNYLVAGE